MQDQREGHMVPEEGDCEVQVASAFTSEVLCTLELPRSSTVLEVKRHVQASQGIVVFRQRLLVLPVGEEGGGPGRAGHQAEDHEALAALPGLRLGLVRLEYADADGDAMDRLTNAAAEGLAPDVESLLRLPLHPDCTRAGDGATALINASRNGHLEVAQLLCEAGADKDKAKQDGATALTMASEGGHLELVRILVQTGADKDKANRPGRTALMAASARGHLEVARLLCKAGADKDKADLDGYTALMWRLQGGAWRWCSC